MKTFKTVEDYEDKQIDQNLDLVPLDTTEKQLLQNIVEAQTKDELQKQFDAFNINQTKKNALRVAKLQGLLGKVEDQAIARMEKHPDQISNKELLEMMNVVSNQIDRAQKSVDSLKDKPMIAPLNQTNEINVNIGTDIPRESKQTVVSAIQSLIGLIQNPTSLPANEYNEVEIQPEEIQPIETEEVEIIDVEEE